MQQSPGGRQNWEPRRRLRRSTSRFVALAILTLSMFPTAGLVAADASPGDKWALVIGISQYRSRGVATNPGSSGDAFDTAQFLSSKGWPAGQTRVITDSDATGAAIREGLAWLASKCTSSSSMCVFKFSGHVKLLKASDGDSESLDEALWAYDSAFIPDGELAGYLRQLQGNAWIDISGCEGGGFDDAVSSSNRLFTASSQEDEKSYESPEWKNSIWTELLVNQGLRNGVPMESALSSATARAPIETSGQKKGAQHPYRAGGADTTWLDGGPAETAPPPPRFCLLGLICL